MTTKLATEAADLLVYLYGRGGSGSASFEEAVTKHCIAKGWIEHVTVGVDDPLLVLTLAGVRAAERLVGAKTSTAKRLQASVFARGSAPHALAPVEIDGTTHTLGEWCRLRGVPLDAVLQRIAAGTAIAEALASPAEKEPPLSNAARGKRFLLDGQERTLKEWSEVLGIAYHTLRKRMFQGMTLEEAARQPWDRRRTGGERNIYYTIGDRTQTLKEWCREFSMPYGTVRNRLSKGFALAVALATPVTASMSRKSS